MQQRQLAGLLALAGGALLVVTAVAALAAGHSASWHDPVATVGYALVLLGLAVLGYLLVASAPVWLRAIVAVCLPLLAASVWQAVVPSIEKLADGSKGHAIGHLLAGLLALSGGGAAALIGRPRRVPTPAGRRVAE